MSTEEPGLALSVFPKGITGDCVFLFDNMLTLVLCESLVGIPDDDKLGDVGIRLGEVVTGAIEWRRPD